MKRSGTGTRFPVDKKKREGPKEEREKKEGIAAKISQFEQNAADICGDKLPPSGARKKQNGFQYKVAKKGAGAKAQRPKRPQKLDIVAHSTEHPLKPIAKKHKHPARSQELSQAEKLSPEEKIAKVSEIKQRFELDNQAQNIKGTSTTAPGRLTSTSSSERFAGSSNVTDASSYQDASTSYTSSSTSGSHPPVMSLVQVLHGVGCL